MTARFILPPAEKSARLSHELEDVASDLKKDRKFGMHRLRYDPAMPLPPTVGGFCDGHRLYVQSGRDSRLVNWLNLWLYVLSIPLLAPALTAIFAKGDTSGYYWGVIAFVAVLSTALFNSWRNSRRAFTKFIVFDRDSGLVMFPRAGRWPDFTVPFDKVEVITLGYVGRGGAHFMAKIMALARPKGMRGKRVDWFLPGHVHNERQALEQWCLITRFMDKSQPEPVPEEASYMWVDVKRLREQNMTLDKLMKINGEISLDPETNWYRWPGVVPPTDEDYQRAQAQAMGMTLEELYDHFGVDESDPRRQSVSGLG